MGLLLVAGSLGLFLAVASLIAIWVAFGGSSLMYRGTCAISGCVCSRARVLLCKR